MPASRKFRWTPILTTLVALAGSSGLIFVVYLTVYVPQKSRADLKEVRQELAAKGESLAPENLIPPPISDDGNFFADPIWTELSDRIPESKGGTTTYVPRVPETKRKVYELKRVLTESERQALEKAFPEFAPINPRKSPVSIALALANKKPRKDDDPRRSAEFSLALLDTVEPFVSHLRRLAARSGARFPIRYEDGLLAGGNHLSTLLIAGQWMHLHTKANLVLDQPAPAREEILDILRLAETLASEPLATSQCGRIAIWRMGLANLNEGLEKHLWSGEDLSRFQEALRNIDFPTGMAWAMRTERALAVQYIDSLVARGKASGGPQAAFFRMYCYPEDMSLYLSASQQWIESLERFPRENLNETNCPNLLEAYLKKHTFWGKYRVIFSKLLLGGAEVLIPTAIRGQTETILGRTAIALEFHFLEKGAYPKSLEELVPKYLSAVPMDPATLRPLVYRRESTGRFRLWSAGWNAIDDNGTIDRNASKGDWVWSGKSF